MASCFNRYYPTRLPSFPCIPPRAPRASPKVDSGESGWGIVINRLISPCALPADYCVLYPRNTLRPIKNRRSLDNQLNAFRPIRAPYPSPAGASAHSPLAQGHRPLAANMGRAGIPPWDTALGYRLCPRRLCPRSRLCSVSQRSLVRRCSALSRPEFENLTNRYHSACPHCPRARRACPGRVVSRAGIKVTKGGSTRVTLPSTSPFIHSLLY